MKLMTVLIAFILSINIFTSTEAQVKDSLNQIKAPVLVTPANGLHDQPVTLMFKWNKVDSAKSYTIHLAFDSLFTQIAYSFNVDTNFKNIEGLSWGTLYYWRVRGYAKGVAGPWSAYRNFATIVRTPSLIYPINYAINLPLSVRLKWSIIYNADYYALEVSTTAGFSTHIFNGNVADTAKQLDSLKNSTTYYWRLRAKNANGYSEYTETYNFTTVPPLPPAVKLVSPSNGSAYQPVTLKLMWDAALGAQSYRVQISKDSLFSVPVYDNSAITTPYIQLYELDNGTKYFWRVSAKTPAGVTEFSKIYNFVTVLQNPENLSAASAGIGKIKLVWIDRSNNEQGFIIERKTSIDQAFSVIDTAAKNYTSYTDAIASAGVTYQYRIKSFTKDAESVYSNVVTFSVPTSVSSLPSVPEEYYLFQNYPNPFNPSTTIKYALPFESSVKLSVYNSLGKVVNEFISQNESAGYHEIPFNASGLPSGLYIYSLKAQSKDGAREFRSEKKMMILK